MSRLLNSHKLPKSAVLLSHGNLPQTWLLSQRNPVIKKLEDAHFSYFAGR